MSVRETIREYQRTSTAIASVVLAIALGIFIWQAMPSGPETEINRAYYTADDGNSWFTDSADKVPPLDHQGQPAYRGMFFKCSDGGGSFAAYLERYPPEAAKKLEQIMAKPPSQRDSTQMMKISNDMEVKKPGGSKWCKALSPEGQEIMNVKPPDGCKGVLQPVFP